MERNLSEGYGVQPYKQVEKGLPLAVIITGIFTLPFVLLGASMRAVDKIFRRN